MHGSETNIYSCALLTASLWEKGPRNVLGSGADSQTFPIADYVFVTPVEVDSGGSYISPTTFARQEKAVGAECQQLSLHYRFSAFGQELHLELKPSAILSSHFIVQVLGKDGASETRGPSGAKMFLSGIYQKRQLVLRRCVYDAPA